MIRTLLEFLIERSLDQGVQPPGWLRWLARRDARLREYSQQALALDRQLRSSAITRRHKIEVGTVAVATPLVHRQQVSEPRFVVRLAWLATAAAILAAGVILFDRHTEQQAKTEQVRLVTAQLVAVPSDIFSLFSEAAQVPQGYSPLGQLKLPTVDPWSDIPRSTQGQLKQSFRVWGSQLSDLGDRVYQRFDLRGETEMN